MALIEAEHELFGLQDPQESVHLNEDSGSEEEYADDDAREETAGQQTSGAPGDGEDGATGPNVAKVVKPKRVIKNPQPKLDVARLCGPRGIGIIQKFLSDAPYRGKGHETEDLGLLLKKLKHWSYRLYPRRPFADNIAQIEKMSDKKPLRVNVMRLRLDMYDTPKEGGADGEVVDAVQRMGGDDLPPDDEQPDVFDELLRQSGIGLQERITTGGAASTELPSSQPSMLTDEQKARIERNKQLALARRQAMLAATAVADPSSSSTPGGREPTARQEQQIVNGKKRSRDEDEDGTENDDDVVQPSPVELRILREGLLTGVISSQTSVVPDKDKASRNKENDGVVENSSSNQKHDDLEDDFEQMDVDDVLDALNKAEDNATNTVAVKALSGNDGDMCVAGASLIDSSRLSVSNSDRELSDKEPRAELLELTPSSPVTEKCEQNSGLTRAQFFERDGREATVEKTVCSEDPNSTGTEPPKTMQQDEHLEQHELDAEVLDQSEEDTNDPNVGETDGGENGLDTTAINKEGQSDSCEGVVNEYVNDVDTVSENLQ